MWYELFLAIIQAATEFLPISSSGHLALFSNLLGENDLFLFTTLHLASLLAVLIYTRKELMSLLTFNIQALKLWKALIIATIPAAFFGFFFHDLIASTFSSFLFLSGAFLFTGIILYATKYTKPHTQLKTSNTFLVGLMQVIALFPGVSRSGMTISAGLFGGLERKQAARFSFLLFIPLSIGAFVLESKNASFHVGLILPFILCLITSLGFLFLLEKVIERGKFWWFSFYCLTLSLISLLLYFFG